MSVDRIHSHEGQSPWEMPDVENPTQKESFLRTVVLLNNICYLLSFTEKHLLSTNYVPDSGARHGM